jgi:hypothetical protein
MLSVHLYSKFYVVKKLSLVGEFHLYMRVKGAVRRELRGVESGVNRTVPLKGWVAVTF